MKMTTTRERQVKVGVSSVTFDNSGVEDLIEIDLKVKKNNPLKKKTITLGMTPKEVKKLIKKLTRVMKELVADNRAHLEAIAQEAIKEQQCGK